MARGWRYRVQILVGARFSAAVQTGLGAHPASHTMGTVSSPRFKIQGHRLNHPTPSRAEVKENVELYTRCNRRNVRDFGRVFLRSNYTDITQNNYIQSWTVTEILAREKSGLLWCLRTVLVSVTSFSPLLELHSYVRADVVPATLATSPASKSV